MGIDWRNYSDHDAEKDNVLTFLSLEFILQMAASYHSKCIGWLAIFLLIQLNQLSKLSTYPIAIS